MSNLIEQAVNSVREWRRGRNLRQDSALGFVMGEYKKHGGVILGAKDDPYRLKVIPDSIELFRQNPDKPISDLEAEREKVQNWVQGYAIQAMLVQRYLRVALGLPPDLPDESNRPETK